MPIFDQGYQHWQGTLTSPAWRWLRITQRGVRNQLKSRWVKLTVLMAWAPALALAAFLVIWGLIEQKSQLIMPLLNLFRDLPEELRAGPREFRLTFWTIAYQFFFQFEMFFSMLLVLLVGPSLISQDLRFNAVPLYFSRPLRRADYFIGKLGVIGVYLGAVAIVPAVIAYVLGVCFSMDLSVVKDTARLFVASLGYGLVVVISAGLLMLAISSLSRNSRYVGAFWSGIWIITYIVAGVLRNTVKEKWCPLLSYTGNLQKICETMLGTREAWEQIGQFMDPRRRHANLAGFQSPDYPWYWSAAVLVGLLGLSIWILTTRVKSLDRLK